MLSVHNKMETQEQKDDKRLAELFYWGRVTSSRREVVAILRRKGFDFTMTLIRSFNFREDVVEIAREAGVIVGH